MKKSKLSKPTIKTKSYYDYHECRDYLQKKYGYDERDYANKFGGKFNCTKKKAVENAPYLDFWHWLLERHSIHNGCFITFSKKYLQEYQDDGLEPWIIEIYNNYLLEFANDGEVEFYVWW